MIDLTGTTAAVANWETDAFKPACFNWAFDTWIRDVACSPDGSYFVIVATGGPNSGTVCDTATRWEASATGTGITPTWTDFSGGDTMLSVAITGPVVYVGGHVRWLNNSFGADSPGPGAVGRASIAALDPTHRPAADLEPGAQPARLRGDRDAVASRTGCGSGTTPTTWATASTCGSGSASSRTGRRRHGAPPTTLADPARPRVPGRAAGRQQRAVPGQRRRPGAAGHRRRPGLGGRRQADRARTATRGSNTASFGPVGAVDATVPAGHPGGDLHRRALGPGR